MMRLNQDLAAPPSPTVTDTTHFPCEGYQKQLFREVDAKLQARTLPVKTVDVLKLLPHFTADVGGVQ